MPNRLANALSPYLRSHADNPVDWREWGAEPFDEAARRDVPVLVSIGYSTCHWCHVMARESFSDPELADYLNEHFVAIKVDREEYPDVDSSYMTSASAFTEGLGWPLNVFVTPQGKAFFAGTYWPPEAAGGHPSFRQVLEAVTDAWTDRRDALEGSAAQVAEALAAQSGRPGGTLPGDEDFDRVVGHLLEFEDTRFGGFGTAPKFPVVPVLLFLLERGSLGDFAALGARGAHPARDGGFSAARPGRRRVLPLRHAAGLVRAALRADALRQRAAAHRVHAVVAAFGKHRGAQHRGLRGHRTLSAERAAAAERGIRLRAGQREHRRRQRESRATTTPSMPRHARRSRTRARREGAERLERARDRGARRAGTVLEHPEWVDAAAVAADYLLAEHLLQPTPPASGNTAASSRLRPK